MLMNALNTISNAKASRYGMAESPINGSARFFIFNYFDFSRKG